MLVHLMCVRYCGCAKSSGVLYQLTSNCTICWQTNLRTVRSQPGQMVPADSWMLLSVH